MSLLLDPNYVGVDGFRFDLGSILARDSQGQLQSFPSLLWELREDAQLQDVKMVL